MTAVCGLTKNGKPSKHTLENTGPRRFLVVEFDPTRWGDLSIGERVGFTSDAHYYATKRDGHAALLWHMATYAPLSAVVFSGKKSLHGWFSCQGQDEEHLLKFMRYAVSLGADRATWTKSQFVRLPEGRRDNGALQAVIYLNPKTLN